MAKVTIEKKQDEIKIGDVLISDNNGTLLVVVTAWPISDWRFSGMIVYSDSSEVTELFQISHGWNKPAFKKAKNITIKIEL